MSFHHTAIGMIIASQAVDIHTTCIVIELIPWKKKDNSHNALFSFCDFSQGEKTSLASKLTHSLPWQLKVGFLFRFFFSFLRILASPWLAGAEISARSGFSRKYISLFFRVFMCCSKLERIFFIPGERKWKKEACNATFQRKVTIYI